MVRTRTHEAAVVGVLAALATFCALEARGGQPYSVVGQSTAKTASTGKRPIAERIKAANRPIRMTPDAELAPDEGLIRELGAGDDVVKRDWPLVPPVVEMTDAEPLVATEPESPAEPAVVPPPGEDAVAANPTTADDAGMVGEVAVLDADEQALAAAGTADAGGSEATTTPTAPRPVPAVRGAPPRRTTARVTPQRREALLGRLRAALAEMPRPFGLLPQDDPRPAPRAARPQPPRRAAPVAVASVPPVLEPAPAAGADGVGSTGGPADDVAGTDSVETPVTDGTATEDASPAEESSVAADAPAAEVAPDAVATTTVDRSTDDAAGAASVAGEGEVDATENGVEEAEPIAAASTEEPAETRPAPASAQRPMARPTPTRTRAPNSIVHRPRPFERLQATLDALPRPLGILPAPRPEMHAAHGPRRNATASSRAVAQASRRPAPNPSATAAPAAAEPGTEPGVVSPDGEQESLAVTEATPDATPNEAPAESVTATDASAGVPGTGTEPGVLAADDTTADAAMPESVACIEVTVEGPEGAIERGGDVTLHLTVRNTGNSPARAVTPVIHFGEGIEPKGIAGREGTLTEPGTVVIEGLAELGPGESVDVEIVATCHQVGVLSFQGVAWCGEGEDAEEVPVDGEVRVVPGRIAAAPEGPTRR